MWVPQSHSIAVPNMGWGSCHYCLCLSYCSLCDLSILHCAETVHSALMSSSGGVAICVVVDSVSVWEEMSSGSSHRPPSGLLFFKSPSL